MNENFILAGLLGLFGYYLYTKKKGDKVVLLDGGKRKVKKQDLDSQKVESLSEDLSGQKQPTRTRDAQPPPTIQETGLPGTTN